LPGALSQAEADADTFFGVELPSLATWSFTQQDAKRIRQPVLVVLGDNSGDIFAERHELLVAWLPSAESYVLPSATHLLHLQNPQGFTEALTDFLARHPCDLHAEPLVRARQQPSWRAAQLIAV
jgi:pimeloyl-ACP methyl ester carboxylesterase